MSHRILLTGGGGGLLLVAALLSQQQAAVVSVTVRPDTLWLQPGDVAVAVCEPRNPHGTILTNACAWTSFDTSKAKTTSNTQRANITGLKSGAVRVRATVKGKADTMVVVVANQPDTTTPPDTTPTPPDTTPPPVTSAQSSADSFVSSASVQTHLGYSGGVYDTQWSTVIRPRLLELGVRHIRERMGTNATVIARTKDLAANGIKLTAGCWADGDYTDASQCVAKANAYGPETIDAFDGQNEMEQLGTGWEVKFTNWQKAQWQAYQASPVWRTRPVFANTLAHYQSAASLGDLSGYMTHGNVHSYPCGVNAQCLPSNVKTWQQAWDRIDGADPEVATETGIHTCPTCAGIGMSPLAQAKLVSRLWFEYWNAGVYRTNYYELIDQGVSTSDREKNWGLLQNNGTPKPSFTVTKNIIALLKDPGGHQPVSILGVTLTDADPATHHTTLAKGNGTVLVALWQEKPVWDASAKRDITNAPDPVGVEFESPRAWKLYQPRTGLAAIKSGTNQRIVVDVPDEVVLLEVGR